MSFHPRGLSPMLGAAIGAGADRLLGEPPLRWHPVARYGSLMERIERTTYADSRAAGCGHLVVGLSTAVGIGLCLRRVIGSTPATAIATFVCVAGKMLDDEALSIAGLLSDGDLPAARTRLKSLVGRATEQLDASEVSRAVIESVAENCVDAVTASLMWAGIGGAPAVLAHRAVNTLDAMVGHRNDRYARFGWASARLDDVVNFVPARLTALAVAISTPSRVATIARIVRRDAPQHPSPNGGVVEAAFAAALDVRLGGVNTYGAAVENRGTLGDGPPPSPADITAAVALRRRSTLVVTALLTAAALSRRLTRRLHR